MQVWRPQLNPIIVREVRTRMRGVRPYLMLTAFLVLLALAGLGIYQIIVQQARFGGMILSAQVGQGLFRGLAFVELLLVVFLAPSLTSGAISGEREGLTYDMLMATPLRPEQILWGKLVAALSYVFLLIFAAIPVFSVVFVFGGVESLAFLKTLALLVTSAVFFGMLGMFCSALLGKTTRATTVAYTLLLLIVGVPIVLASVWGQFSVPPGQPPPPPLIYIQPFSALMAITTITPPREPEIPFFGFSDPLSMIPFMSMLWQGVLYFGPTGPTLIPIYRATLILYAFLTVLLGWITTHLALPMRRWRPRWSDLGFIVLLVGIGWTAYLTRSWWYILPPPPGPQG